jgi:hypothetical protein
MSDRDIPEADAQEQRRGVTGDDAEDDRRPRPDDAAEADVQEQREGVRRVGRPRAARSAEVPEADAQEQAQELDDDEEDLD